MSYQNNIRMKGKAEQAFFEAFERLKKNETLILPKGSLVSQNNVAKENGRDPSALKKSRYPELINEIQRWINDNQPVASPTPRQKIILQRKKNRSLKESIFELKTQRDNLASLLVEADAKILELTMENARLQSNLQETTTINKNKISNNFKKPFRNY